MPRAVIIEKFCKGCQLCVHFCPKGALVLSDSINAQGVRPVICLEDSECTGCLNCTAICPDAAIEIRE